MDKFYSNPFRSFWMGGFECTDQLNSSGNRVDLLHITGHLANLSQDYERLIPFNIRTVREGIRWAHIEKQPYQYDFSTVETMLQQAEISGIQQVWDICHFGFPDDLSPLHPHFTARFVSLCEAFVRFYRSCRPHDILIVTPINEVGFLSWLGGEVGGTSPYSIGNGWNVKYALMKAYIQGIYAMKAIDPGIRILTTEPLVNIVPVADALYEDIENAAQVHEEQFQCLDMLAGSICPELGGSPDLLDILGFNFYYNNQWEVGFNNSLSWFNESNDPRWRPFSSLITDACHRYNRPVVLTETSHPGKDRALWMGYIANECVQLIQQGIPFWGVCLYPIIDRPDWDNLDIWHHSGLWDFEPEGNLQALNKPYALALRISQHLLNYHVNHKKQEVISL